MRLVLGLKAVDLRAESRLKLLLSNELVAEAVNVLVAFVELVLLGCESVDGSGELNGNGSDLLLVLNKLAIMSVVVVLSGLKLV